MTNVFGWSQRIGHHLWNDPSPSRNMLALALQSRCAPPLYFGGMGATFLGVSRVEGGSPFYGVGAAHVSSPKLTVDSKSPFEETFDIKSPFEGSPRAPGPVRASFLEPYNS